MAPESRAEYFRELRKKKKQFVVLVDNEKMKLLDEKLAENGETRTAWLHRKIEEEIGTKK